MNSKWQHDHQYPVNPLLILTSQEDRKKLISERRDREREADRLRSELAAARSASRSELEEAKSRLIVERHEREKETNDHAIMLR